MIENYTTSVFLSTTKPTVWGEDQFTANLLIQTHCFLMIINLLSHHHSILKAMTNMGVIIPHSVGLPLMEKLRRGSCFRLPKSQWRKLCAQVEPSMAEHVVHYVQKDDQKKKPKQYRRETKSGCSGQLKQFLKPTGRTMTHIVTLQLTLTQPKVILTREIV